MNTPEWLKPGIYGAVIGAVFVGVVGFTWSTLNNAFRWPGGTVVEHHGELPGEAAR